MIIKGSMNYDRYGRKRKKAVGWSRHKRKEYQWEKAQRSEKQIEAQAKKVYPSAEPTPYTPAEDTSYKQEVSKQYTVAIAYNKGAYQVIPRKEVKDIGK